MLHLGTASEVTNVGGIAGGVVGGIAVLVGVLHVVLLWMMNQD